MGLFDEEERCDEKSASERDEYVEIQTPAVATRQHVASVQWTGRAPAKAHSVEAESLSALVKEEDVVDELNGKCFADSTAQRVDDASSHETAKAGGLRCTHKTEEKEEHGKQHHRPSSEFQVSWDQKQRAESINEIWVRDYPRGDVWGDVEFFSVNSDVYRRTEKCCVTEE